MPGLSPQESLIKKNIITLRKGDKIYVHGLKPSGFYRVVEGLIGLLINDCNGKERIIRLYDNGGYFGCRSFISGENYHSTSFALKETIIEHYLISSPQELMQQSPDDFFQISMALSKELGEAEHRLANMANMKVRSRIIDTLIHLLNRYPDYHWTRREIAEFCGCEPETAIRICRALEKDGLITSVGRQLKIADQKTLATLRNS